MNMNLSEETQNIDWEKVVEILKEVRMSSHAPEVHQRAFENSFSKVFVFDNEVLIGFGRAISDGEYQAALYDIAVLPSYQGKGIGKMVVQHLVSKTPHCNFILYASPGKEAFYEKEGFRKMKTGMALFVSAERMAVNGFTE
jgi:GNAT superfamily N-acetyltransferase